MTLKTRVERLEKQAPKPQDLEALDADIDNMLAELADLVRAQPGRLEEMRREADAEPDPELRRLDQAIVIDLEARLHEHTP